MMRRYSMSLLGTVALAFALPASAKPTTPCGPGGCPSDPQVRQSTIIPSDAFQFSQIGDNFQNVATEINFAGANFAAVDLGFSVNFGGGATSLAYISKSGAITFGSPLIAYQQTDSLQNLNVPVIAPYYAKLETGQSDGRPDAGDVLIQFGSADVYPDNRGYSMSDLLPAVRITWYGVTQDVGPAAGAMPVYAQLVLTGTSDDGSYSTAQFRYGTDTQSAPAGNGIGGFSLYGTSLQFGGPFSGNIPNFLEFSGGSFIGQGATGSSGVPEPAAWLELIVGVGLLGVVLRHRSASQRSGLATAI